MSWLATVGMTSYHVSDLAGVSNGLASTLPRDGNDDATRRPCGWGPRAQHPAEARKTSVSTSGHRSLGRP
jgi:hypothetical protein